MECPNCHSPNSEDSRYCSRCAAPLGLEATLPASLTKTLTTPLPVISKDALIAGKYKIVEEIGRGGMGIVFKAEDIRLKRTVALKFLPPELTHIPDVKDRFMREAQAAAALDHPNICTVYEFDQAEGKAFISMAYIEGQSLKKMIDSGPLELEEALKIAIQVAEGLQEAHKKGIVHRDVKSANIMVTEKNQVKVMDFGLARTTGGTLLTKEGTTMGTIAYMSPEQARGEEIDHRTDIWSLGVVLYEMFSGQLPFKGERDQSVVYSILNEKPRPVTDLRSEIPVSIAQVVSKALEKNPNERYQQAEELLDDLKSIAAGIVPEEIKARLRKAKLRKRKRAILYAGSAGLIVIMAVLALSLFTGRPEAIDSIAVLPFENLTGDSEKEYFVDGATDELIGQLSKIGALQVRSRTTVMQFKGVEKSIPEIARELNVDAVVEGTIYQIGEKVRITVRLYDALPEERKLWAETYERSMTDVVVMYSDMARAIADKARVNMTAAEMTRLTNVRQVNPRAYEAYLKGEHNRSMATRSGLETAERYLNYALELDPDYAAAWAGIAGVWVGRNQLGMVPRAEAIPKAKEAALKALDLDDTEGEAHRALASILTWSDWNWTAAEKEWNRMIELNPDAEPLAGFSHFLMHMGRPDEAMVWVKRALELDPFNAKIHSFYALDLLYVRRYDDAVAAARAALGMQPGAPVARSALQYAFFQKGMYDEALALDREMFAKYPELKEALEQGYAEAGYAGAYKRLADVLAARFGKPGGIRAADLAHFYLYAGEKEHTLEWLERGCEERDASMPYLGLPIFDLVRSDPRFQDLLRRIGLPTNDKKREGG